MESKPDIKILVVEDDANTQLLLQTFLKKYPQFQLSFSSLGSQALTLFEAQRPDIVILDIMLPDMSGLDVISQLRSISDAGIIMLSGSEVERDKIVALDRGADVYLQKPVDLIYLQACINRLYVRLNQASPVATQPEVGIDKSTKWILNKSNWSLEYEGTSVMLTPSEFKLIDLLIESGDAPASISWLGQQLQRKEYDDYGNVISTLISRLRKKLKQQVQADFVIKSYRSEGYVLLSHVVRA